MKSRGVTKRTPLFILLITTGLLISTSPQSSSAPVIKKGAACKTLNKKTDYENKTFTCIKKNNKLVWNKGVKIKASNQAAPAPTPTPTPTLTVIPTPAATATPSPSPTVDSKPTSTPTPKPTPKPQTPLEKLYADIYQRYLSADKKISPSFNFVSCPNVDKNMVNLTESSYVDAYSFWADIYKARAKVNWLFMGEKDWDCWYENTAKFEGPNSVSRSWKVWDKETGILGHCKVSPSAFCGYGTGVREGGIFAQYNLIGSAYKSQPTALTVHHETVHIYQMQLEADNYPTSKVNTMACWFIEGQANMFGVPIAFNGNPTTHRNFEISRLLNVYPKGSSYTKDEWLNVLNDLKKNTDFCFKNELGYSLGWFALEWTYLNYSIEQMHSFQESIVKGLTWEQAIQKTMNMDEQGYLAKIAQYLSEQI